MKKLLAIVMVLIVCAAPASVALADSSGPSGPAPNSGDGIPDGSGLEAPNGANGDVWSDSGSVGPAPNSGDGIPDGSGF